ncbi:MAG: MMPL family transporter, partial [Deltaproteobacteria bacterium]|nr:MMPL family transporter [Deltaproteobacteria bacterium]
RARWPLALAFTLFFAFCVSEASHLKLRSDFKELLPENFQSLKDLDRILKRVGGEGSLIVAIESDDPAASIRFANDLVAKLHEYPPEYIKQIDYNVSEVKHFFEDHKYLYMDLEDIKTLYDRLNRRIQRQKLKSSGLFLSFETKEEEEQAFSTKDIEDKYQSKTGQYQYYRDGYFFDKDGKVMAVVLRPPGTASGIDFSRRLVAKVDKTIADLEPKKYHPSMQVGLTGKFRRVLFEYQTLIEDVVSTAVLCASLVGLVVLLYYRKVRMVLLMAWAVFNGGAWSFAIAYWKIGYLTTQTAFLGSIIIGNGINYSLILMARYMEERKNGANPLDSMLIAIPATFSGTLASSLTTSVSFATLMLTQVRGFVHFGFIGGLGMFLCWVATYTVLPVFLGISEQVWPLFKANNQERFKFSFMAPLADRLNGWAKTLTIAGVAMSVLSVPLIIHYFPNSLEYDFSKLRVKSKGKESSEESVINDKVKKIFTGSLTPAVLVTDSTDQVRPLCREIVRKNEQNSRETRVLDSCKSLFSFVPEQQPEKIEWLQKMRALLEDDALNFLNEKQRKELEQFKTKFTSQPVTVADLPEGVVKNYREKNGDLGKIVYIYPSDLAPLWNGKNLIRFADMIRSNTLPDGTVITGSGDSVIFADLLRAVIHDGPRATIYAFLAVCLVVALIFRNRPAIYFIIGTLMLGVLWMGGLVALFDFKINFFNFIAIPTTFGIGVDYGVNIYQRYSLEGRGSVPRVLKTTGGAVALCSLTTIIGYFTLIIAKNQALVSFGWIAIIGEITCVAAALVFVPALVIMLERRKSPSSEDSLPLPDSA